MRVLVCFTCRQAVDPTELMPRGVMAASPLPNCDVHVCELAGLSVLITVRGDLDLASRDRLAGAIGEAAARAVGDVILDLADLRFCDATGLGVMVAAQHDLARAGRRLVLINASCRFRRLLDVAQVGFLLDTPAIPGTRARVEKPRGERPG